MSSKYANVRKKVMASSTSSNDKYIGSRYDFSNLQNEIAKVEKNMSNDYSNWQDADTLDLNARQAKNVSEKLDLYERYLRANGKYTDADAVSSSIASLNNARKGYSDVKKMYSNFSDADSYNLYKRTSELRDKYKGYTYDKVQRALNLVTDEDEIEYLKNYGVNGNYSSLKDYDADIAARKAAGETSYAETSNAFERIYNNITDQDKSTALDKVIANRNKYDLENHFELYQDKMNNADYSELSKYNSKFSKDARYEAMNNPDLVNVMDSSRSDIYSNIRQNLTDDEAAMYNYIYSTEGQDAADAYYDEMSKVSNYRKQQEHYADIDSLMDTWDNTNPEGFHPNELLSSLLSAGSVVASPFATLYGMTSTDTDAYSSDKRLMNDIQYIRGKRSKQMEDAYSSVGLSEDLGRITYNSIASGVESALGGLEFGNAYTPIMGLGSYQATRTDLIEKGATSNQAEAGATIAGFLEWATEQPVFGDWLDATPASNFSVFLTNMVKQFAEEGMQEGFTEAANLVVDWMNMGGASDAEELYSQYISSGKSAKEAYNLTAKSLIAQVGEAALTGGLSGAGMSAGQSFVTHANLNTQGAELSKNSKAYDVFDIAMNAPEGSELRNAYDVLTKKGVTADTVSDAELANLYNLAVEQYEAPTSEAVRNNSFTRLTRDFMNEGNSYEESQKLANQFLNMGFYTTEGLSSEASNLYNTYNKLVSSNKKVLSSKASTGSEEATKATTENVAQPEKVSTTPSDMVTTNDLKAKVEGMDSNAAQTLLDNYDSKYNVQEYYDSAELMYEYGRIGMGVESALKNRGVLDYSTASKIYTSAMVANSKLKQNAIAEKLRNYNKTSKSGRVNASNIDFSKDGSGSQEIKFAKLSKEQQQEFFVMSSFAMKFGFGINFTNRANANGFYNPETNEITVDLHSGKVNGAYSKGRNIATLSHELVHFSKEKSPEFYRMLSEAVMNHASTNRSYNNGASVEQILSNIIDTHKNITTIEGAIEELTAMFCEDMLSNTDTFSEFISELNPEEAKTIVDKIKDFIEKILDGIKELIGIYAADTEESKALREVQEDFNNILKLYDQMLKDALDVNTKISSLNAETIGESLLNGESEAIQDRVGDMYEEEDFKSLADEKYSLREDGVLFDKTWKYIHNKKSKLDSDVLRSTKVVRTMIQKALMGVEHLMPEDVLGQTLVNNASYGKTIENSLVCIRSLVSNYFIDQVSEYLETPLTIEEQFVAAQILAEITDNMTECAYCYVKNDRAAYREFLKTYFNQYTEAKKYIAENKEKFNLKELDKFVNAKDGTIAGFEEFLDGRANTSPMRTRYAAWVKEVLNNDSSITLKDLSSTSKRNAAKNGSGNVAWLVNDAEAYAQSASWQKALERTVKINGEQYKTQYIAYNGSILNLSDYMIKKLNGEYGLRMYSYSDYVPQFLLENIQMITDASARGLKMLSYTKDINYAKLFARTGMLINISVRGEWNEETKTVDKDEMMGASWEETKAVRAANPNVGVVFVGTNDNEVRWAMAQDWIDVVIPYHTVRVGERVATFFNGIKEGTYYDYKDEQADKKTDAWRGAKKGAKKGTDLSSIPPTIHGNDKATFLNACKENHLTPRFERFIDDPNYMKLVNETRLPYTEAHPVTIEGFAEEDFLKLCMSEVKKIGEQGAYGHLQGFMNDDGTYNYEKEKEFLDSYVSKAADEIGKYNNSNNKFSEREYAPTFYSAMAKEISNIKQDKIGAASVVSYLKGKGIKDEEIKWSGIEAFLEGKKSVTKAELEEFAKGSMLQIEEKTLHGKTDKLYDREADRTISKEDFLKEVKDYAKENGWTYEVKEHEGGIYVEYFDEDGANIDDYSVYFSKDSKWDSYTTEGTTNYREILFKMPKADYTNQAMNVHWGEKGVIAHARVDDMNLTDGSKMLFVEEIQSDWHNEGKVKGYKKSKSEIEKIEKTLQDSYSKAVIKFYESEEFDSLKEKYQRNKNKYFDLSEFIDEVSYIYPFGIKFGYSNDRIVNAFGGDIYNQNITESEEIALKELGKAMSESRKVVKNSGVSDAPFKTTYTDYVMKRLIRMAAEEGYDYIGWTTGKMQEERWSDEYAEGYRIEYDQDVPKFMNKYGKKWGAKVSSEELDSGKTIHAFKIPESMKDSVLYEGQVMYSERDSEGRTLTKEQQEYFKDSKVRDENGNLIRVYHGSNSKGFTIFNTVNDREYGAHFGTKNAALNFSNKMYEGYLNIKNPITMPDIFGDVTKLSDYVNTINNTGELINGKLLNGVTRKPIDIINTKVELPANKEFVKYSDAAVDWAYNDGSEEGATKVAKLAQKYLKSLGYDGVKYTNNFEDINSDSWMVLDSNQFKNLDNQNPTDNPDIRFSDRDETIDGFERLSKGPFEKLYIGIKNFDGANILKFDTITKEDAEYVTKQMEESFNKEYWYNDMVSFVNHRLYDIETKEDGSFVVANIYNKQEFVSILERYVNGEIDGERFGRKISIMLRNAWSLSEDWDLRGTSELIERAKEKNKADRHVREVVEGRPYFRFKSDSYATKYGKIREYLEDEVGNNIEKFFSDYIKYANEKNEEMCQIYVDVYARYNDYTEHIFHSTGNETLDEFDNTHDGIHVGAKRQGLQRPDVVKTIDGYAKTGKSFYIYDDFGMWGYRDISEAIISAYEHKPIFHSSALSGGLVTQIADVSTNVSEKAINDLKDLMKESINPYEGREGLYEILSKEGYDSIRYYNVYELDLDYPSIILFHSNQFKSSDAITYRNDGSIIGLEERFSESTSFRFSTRPEELSEYKYLNKEIEKLKKENESLKVDVDRLKEKLKLERTVTNGNVLNQNQIDIIARKLRKKYDSKIDIDLFKDGLNEVYNYINTSENIEWQEIFDTAEAVAEEVVRNRVVRKETDSYFKGIKDDIKNTAFSINDVQRQELESAFGKDWKKFTRNKLKITNGAIPLESVWSEWASRYPELFSEDISDADMITAIYDVYDYVDRASEVVVNYNEAEAVRELAIEIYNQYWNVNPVRTLSDKYQNKIKQMKVAHRQMMSDIRNKERAKNRDILQAVVKENKELRKKNKTASRDAVKALKEMQEEKNYVAKVEKVVLELKNMLLNNSADSHIPEQLKIPTANIVEAIDFSSQRILEGGDATTRDKKFIKALEDVRNMADIVYRRNLGDETVGDSYLGLNIDLPSEYVETIDGILKKLINMSNGDLFVLRKMNSEQLKDLYDVLKAYKTAIKQINIGHTAALKQGIAYNAQNTIEYLKDMGEGKDKWKILKYDMATPVTMFDNFGEGGQNVFRGLTEGAANLAFKIQELKDFTSGLYTPEQKKSWDNKIITFSYESGEETKTFKMNVSTIMYLYALSKREQGRKHLFGKGEGFRVENFKDNNKVVKQSDTFKLSEEDMNRLLENLDPEAIRVADALQRYMSTTLADWFNEVTMIRWGIKQAYEDNYVPIISDARNINQDTNVMREASLYKLLNMGFTKQLQKNANNQIVVMSLFDVFANHASDVAKYNTIALPVLDTIRWLNYTEKNEEGNKNGTRRAIAKAYNDNAISYVTRLITDLNGTNHGDDLSAFDFLVRNAKIASVAANLRVALLQPTSYFRASYIIDDKYLAKAATSSWKKGYETALKYSGIANWKKIGLFDTNISKTVEKQISNDNTLKEKIIEASMKPAEFGDNFTWGKLWNACEYQVEEKISRNADNFYDEVTKLFEDMIYRTQVVDSVLTRSQVMRRKGKWTQIATAFMSEPTISYNMLMQEYNAWTNDARRSNGDYSKSFKKHGKKMAKAIAAYTITNVMAALVEATFDRIRKPDDDDDEAEWEKFMEAFWENFKQDMSLIGKIPVVKTALDTLFNNYSSTEISYSAFEYAKYAFNYDKRLFTGKDVNIYKLVYKNLKAASSLSGIPAANVVRDAVAIWNKTIGSIFEDLKIETE